MTAPAAVRPDLYWHWLEATNFVHTRAQGRGVQWWIQLLIELRDGQDPNPAKRLHEHLRIGNTGFVPSPYRKRGVLFCTAWVSRQAIPLLPPELVVRFKAGIATQRRAKSADASRDWDLLTPQRYLNKNSQNDLPTQLHPTPVLAIIDDCVDVTHPAFLGRNGRSRIALAWDQSGNWVYGTPKKWPNFGYHRLLGDNRPWVDSVNKRKASHGTAVSAAAGGSLTPAYRMRHSSPQRYGAARPNDPASEVPMAVVMLPDETVADTSGGALGVNVLDAMTFLLNEIPKRHPLVVNLSFGTMGGPHDGTSVLEAALEHLRQRQGGRLSVVMPAGNSFLAQCHADFTLAAGEEKVLTWRILPDDKTSNFCEIWLPAGADVEIEAVPPDGVPCMQPVATGGSSSATWPHGGLPVTGGVWVSDRPANGMNGQFALIATAPTSGRHASLMSRHGDWKVRLKNRSKTAATPVQVWIERDNATYGRKPLGRQSYLVDAASVRSTEERTITAAVPRTSSGFGSLNGIATGAGPVVVGGFELRTGDMARYSSAGTQARAVRAPDGTAPSEEGPLQHGGLPVVSNTPNGRTRMGGTSVAAPLVSRWFVNQLLGGAGIPWPKPGPADPQKGADRHIPPP